MALSSKIRQRRWKERQVNKRQVSVMLSIEAYNDLGKIKDLRGTNYSDIVEKAIANLSEDINHKKPERKKKAGELSFYYDRNQELEKTSATNVTSKKKENRPSAEVGNASDIHRLKQRELVLQELQKKLETELKIRTASLEEADTALKLMLNKEKEIMNELENRILRNIKQSVFPFVKKLKTSKMDRMQRRYVSILESRLNEILSPFLHSLNNEFRILTPREIQIADLLKDGMDTKEIADLLNLSTRTIEFHRARIREKLGIKNKKTNLRSKLLSFY